MTRAEIAIIAGFAAALLATAAATAHAQPKETKVDNMTCWGGSATVISPVQGTAFVTWQSTGTVRSMAPGGMFDGASFECIGSQEVLPGSLSQVGYCLIVDRDGDKTWGRSARNKSEDSFVFFDGSGKYKGITGKLDYRRPVAYPSPRAGTFTGCAYSNGTVTLP